MLINLLRKNKYTKEFVYRLLIKRAEDIIKIIIPYLNQNEKILDIGSGTGNIAEILLEEGFKVTPLDVVDISFTNIKPILYDGQSIPFGNKDFDTAIIITVLHHTENPEEIIKEAKRVASKIIIIEDIYSNWIEKYITFFLDSLFT